MGDTDLDNVLKFAEHAIPESGEKDKYRLAAALATVARAKAELRTLRDEENASLNLYRKCMERALKIWKEKNPNAHYLPDGTDNFVWILDRLELLEKQLDTAVEQRDE